MTAAVDITGFIPDDTAVLKMTKPGTGDPIGWDITMAGPGHPQTVALGNRSGRKLLTKERAIEMARANGKKFKGDEVDADASRREFVEDIVARIVTWTPIAIGGETYEFDAKRAAELLLQPRMLPYFNQLVTYLTEESAFIPASATA